VIAESPIKKFHPKDSEKDFGCRQQYPNKNGASEEIGHVHIREKVEKKSCGS